MQKPELHIRGTEKTKQKINTLVPMDTSGDRICDFTPLDVINVNGN